MNFLFFCLKAPVLSVLLFSFLSGTNCFGQTRRGANQSTYRPYYPDDPSARNSFACGMGDAGACLPISAKTLRELDSCAASVNIDGSIGDIGFLLMNRYADSVFFQELANRSVAATNCQVQILSGNTQPVVDSAWRVFQTLQPLLTALIEERDREREGQEQELRRLSLTASDSAVNGVLSRRTARFQSINEAIEKLLGQLPFGEQGDVKSAVRGLAGRNVTQAQFAAAYRPVLPTLKAKYEEAQSTFESIKDKSTGEYNLSFAHKTELYSAPDAQALLNQLDPQGTSLRCRFNSCYVEGPRNEKFAALIGLGAVTVLSLGSASPFLAAGVAVGAATLSLTQAYDSCFQQSLNVTAQIQASCTPENLAQTTVSQMSATSCAVDATMLALDVVLPGFAGARRLTQAGRASRALAGGGTAAAEKGLGVLVRSSPDGTQVYRNAEGVEASISASGRREYRYPDGGRIIEENGMTTTRYADGSRSVRSADGITTNYDEAGSVVSRVLADGSTEGSEIVVTGTRTARRAAPTPARAAIALTDESRAAAQESLLAKGITPENYRTFFSGPDGERLASNLSDNERIYLFEQYSGLRLNEADAARVIELHQIGRGFGSYTQEQLIQKALGIRTILRNNGITDSATVLRVADDALGNGVLGRQVAQAERPGFFARLREALIGGGSSRNSIPENSQAIYRTTGAEVLDETRRSPEFLSAGNVRTSDLFSPRFTGTADEMVRSNAFRDDAIYGGQRDLWWDEVTITGRESRSPLASVYADAAGGIERVRRTVYWPRTQREASGSIRTGDFVASSRPTALDSYRVVVNQSQDASGRWADQSLEMIVRDPDGTYRPMFYVKRGEEWVPSRTFRGEPVAQACIKCHHRPPNQNVFTAFPFARASANVDGLAHGYRPFANRMIAEGGGVPDAVTAAAARTRARATPEQIREMSMGDLLRLGDEVLPGRGLIGDATNTQRRRAIGEARRASPEDAESILRFGMPRAQADQVRLTTGSNPAEVFSEADTLILIERGFAPQGIRIPAPATGQPRTPEIETPAATRIERAAEAGPPTVSLTSVQLPEKSLPHIGDHVIEDADEVVFRRIVAERDINLLAGSRLRSQKETTLYPPGATYQDTARRVVDNLRSGGRVQILRSNEEMHEVYRVVDGDNVFKVILCRSERCDYPEEGLTLTRGEVRSVFPECGPQIQALRQLESIRGYLEADSPLTRADFTKPKRCSGAARTFLQSAGG